MRRQHPPERMVAPGCPPAGGPITGTEKLTLTIYDMLTHLGGRPIPGINLTVVPSTAPVATQLPADQSERVKAVRIYFFIANFTMIF